MTSSLMRKKHCTLASGVLDVGAWRKRKASPQLARVCVRARLARLCSNHIKALLRRINYTHTCKNQTAACPSSSCCPFAFLPIAFTRARVLFPWTYVSGMSSGHGPCRYHCIGQCRHLWTLEGREEMGMHADLYLHLCTTRVLLLGSHKKGSNAS